MDARLCVNKDDIHVRGREVNDETLAHNVDPIGHGLRFLPHRSRDPTTTSQVPPTVWPARPPVTATYLPTYILPIPDRSLVLIVASSH